MKTTYRPHLIQLNPPPFLRLNKFHSGGKFCINTFPILQPHGHSADKQNVRSGRVVSVYAENCVVAGGDEGPGVVTTVANG